MTTSFATPDLAGTVGTATVMVEDAYGNPVSSGPNLYVGMMNFTSTDKRAEACH